MRVICLIGYHIPTQRGVFHIHKKQNATLSTLSAPPMLPLQNTVNTLLTCAWFSVSFLLTRPTYFLQSSASDCILVSMLAARAQAIKNLKKGNPDTEDSAFLPRLVAYCSQESHSCVEKAAMISLVKLRILEPDDRCSLRGCTLREVRINMITTTTDFTVCDDNNSANKNNESLTCIKSLHYHIHIHTINVFSHQILQEFSVFNTAL